MSKNQEMLESETEKTELDYAPSGEDIEIWFDLMREGDVEKVKKFLEEHKGWDVNLSKETITALLIACEDGHLEIAELLLAHKEIDVNLRDANEASPLFMASMFGRLEIVNLLLNSKEINADLVDSTGCTPLLIACTCDHPEIVKPLLEHDANPNLADGVGITPLYRAAEKQDIGLARLLLENWAIITKKMVGDLPDRVTEVMRQLSPSSVVLVENAAVAENVLEANPELRPVVFDKEKSENYMKFANNRARITLTAKETEYSTFTNSWVRSLYNDQNRHVSDEITQYLYSFLGTQELTPKEMKAIEEYMGSKDTHKNPMGLYMYVVTNKTSFQDMLLQQGQEVKAGKEEISL